MSNLSKNVKYTKISNGATAGTSELDSSIIDMAGFDGAMFFVDLATVVDGSVMTLTVQQNTANSTSGMAAITGASATFTASTSSNKVLMVDVYRPLQEFLRVAFTRTTQNATVNSIYVIQYNARFRPTTQDSGVIASTTVVGS